MTMSLPIRLGIVGCGAVVEDMHLEAIEQCSEFAITHLIDSELGRAEKLLSRCPGAVVSRSMAEARDAMDAVLIATPPHTHLALAKEAFAQGFDVICEKPLANTPEECRDMVCAAEVAGKVLAVGQNFRFYPIRRRLKELLQEHQLGQITHIRATEGKPYRWQSVTGYTVKRELVPGGVLLNAGVHTLDSILYWLGDPVSFDYKDDAVGGLESNCSMNLAFAQGATASFEISRTCNLPYEIVVDAEHGSLRFSTNATHEYTVTTPLAGQAEKKSLSQVSLRDCVAEQYRDFAHAIKNRSHPFVHGAEGSRVIEWVDAMYASKRARPLPAAAPFPGHMW